MGYQDVAKGEEFERKAEKKIKGWGLFGSNSKYEDAADLYQKAANSFKLSKSWDRAAAAYTKLASCHLKSNSNHEAASAYVDSANCYKKISPKEAISCLDQAVNLLLEINRFNMAARYCKEIGELYEKEQNMDEAINYFERAAELFKTEEVNTSASQCMQKVAEFSAQSGKYQKAIEIYEEVARYSLNNNLLKYGATLLAKKTRSKSEWEKVHNEMKSHLERSKDLNNISAILELSYQNLSPELKACFLCLAFFKEDAIIKATKLVQIWVAHGLVPREVEGGGGEVRMEKIARDYLNELISRNLVQVKKMMYDVIKGCQVHDLLRDLSIKKAEEEMDFEVLREEGNSHKCSLNKPRHRVIYDDGIRFVYSTKRNQHLRSLFINRDDKYPYISDGPSSYWKSFELLRFLDLGIESFDVLPEGIGELTGLKYLRMRYGGKRSRLPRSWAKLKNLEVLDLRGSYSAAIKIDKVIPKMESLRHLYARVVSSKAGLGEMRKLRTLHRFRLENASSNAWEIQGLSGVSKLGIEFYHFDGPNSSLFTWLSSLPNLFHLTLSEFLFSSSTDLQGLTSLHRVTRLKLYNPSYMGDFMPLYFPPNLSHLTLSDIRLEEGSMPAMEKLPNLLYLKLKNIRNHNGMREITIGGFPKLKVLRLNYFISPCKMEIKESAMPELNQLIIFNCPNLDVGNVPERIKSAMIVQQSHKI